MEPTEISFDLSKIPAAAAEPQQAAAAGRGLRALYKFQRNLGIMSICIMSCTKVTNYVNT